MFRKPTMQLNNKTALITGAARGIGQATAIELANSGADIFGVDVHEAGLQETEKAVKKTGRRFVSFICDLSDPAAVEKLIEQAAKTSGGFDILINNAGVLPSGPFSEGDFGIWRKTIEINLLALMHITHLALPHLLQRETAHIVNLASISGKFGSEGLVAYGTSKHGVVGFSSSLRAELAAQNIGVSWICPSFVKTRLTDNVWRHFLTPMLSPEKVARAIRVAISKNQSEVILPKSLRLTTAVLPALFPNLAHKISKRTKVSQGWLEENKPLQM
jgi:all-trans-retinol dehydrogenase (NAD+)